MNGLNRRHTSAGVCGRGCFLPPFSTIGSVPSRIKVWRCITCLLSCSTRPELAAAGPGTAVAISSPNIADSSSTTVASEIQNVPQVRSTCRKTDSEIQSAVKYLELKNSSPRHCNHRSFYWWAWSNCRRYLCLVGGKSQTKTNPNFLLL